LLKLEYSKSQQIRKGNGALARHKEFAKDLDEFLGVLKSMTWLSTRHSRAEGSFYFDKAARFSFRDRKTALLLSPEPNIYMGDEARMIAEK
jgi:hypothetical protein